METPQDMYNPKYLDVRNTSEKLVAFVTYFGDGTTVMYCKSVMLSVKEGILIERILDEYTSPMVMSDED